VKAGADRHDEFFRRTQLLLARVERAERAVESAELSAPPAGVRIRIEGEGPEALVEVSGDAEPGLLLRTVAAADDLANAPRQMDAVPAEVDRLLSAARRFAIGIYGVPGGRGFRLREAHAEALRHLADLPARARRVGGSARELLGRLRGS